MTADGFRDRDGCCQSESAAAVCLGYGKARPAKRTHFLPHRLVESGFREQLPSNFGHRGFPSEKFRCRIEQHALLFAEGQGAFQ